jgi:hypothetical protein
LRIAATHQPPRKPCGACISRQPIGNAREIRRIDFAFE